MKNIISLESSLFREWRVLEAVYQEGEITRHQIESLTGLNRTSVIRVVSELINKELLLTEENRNGQHKRGRPSELLRINPESGYILGLEFGRNHLITVIIDAVGRVRHWKQEASAPTFVGADSTINEIIDIARAVTLEAGISWEKIMAFGLALHDVVSAEGTWRTHERLKAAPYDVKQYLEDTLGCAIVIEDVSRAFAEVEHRFGAGRGSPDMLYVFLGSHGVGGGIFINNTLLKSASGICGEIGHIVVEEGGALCTCGNRGCFETVASHSAVVAQFEALVREGMNTSLSDVQGPVSFKQICRAAGEGDKGSYIVLHQLAQKMGKALASVVNICGTPLVVVGGQLEYARNDLLTDLSIVLRRNVIPTLAKQISVKYAEMPIYGGAWGVAIQALATAWAKGTFLTSAENEESS